MILSVFAALALFSGLAMSAPVPTYTINNPCGEVPFASQVFLPVNSALSQTIIAINNDTLTADKLITALRGPGFLTEDDIEVWNADVINLLGLPLHVQTDNVSLENIEGFLSQAYNDTSIHIVYLQEALSDQISFDNSLLKNELSTLKNEFLKVLCNVHTLLKSKGVTLTSFVDASVMPSVTKNIQDHTMRYIRNYVLGNDNKIFLGNLKSNYTSLLNDSQV